jgi:hypothetical protein
MKPARKLLFILSILVIAALACSLGAPAEEPVSEAQEVDSAATFAVQTSQAQIQDVSALTTVTETPPASAPTVTVSTDTNCRTGPGVNYGLVMIFKVGMSAEVVATYPDYWIIEYPGGNGATCWLWDEYATVIGDTSQLPVATPPPPPPTATPGVTSTPAPSGPKSPKIIDIAKSCEDATKPGDLFPSWKVKVFITWKDNSTNEKGFNIYKFGSLLTTVPENYTQHIDSFTHSIDLQGSEIEYGVQSFNDDGKSEINKIKIGVCP